MRLTGAPLILLVGLATAATGTGTVLLWRRRLLPLRVAGILLAEVLVVAGVGLVVNRAERFYPSWQALRGDTGTTTTTAATPSGLLDGRFAGASEIVWRPSAESRWKLAGPPRIVVPAGYRARAHDTFPVVLALVPAARPALAEARRLHDAVTVVLVPTRGTTAAALRTLPDGLRRDVRVTTGGWDVVSTGRTATLAAALVRTQPPGFEVARGWAPDRLSAPLAEPMRLPL
jgi:hypothetical protein